MCKSFLYLVVAAELFSQIHQGEAFVSVLLTSQKLNSFQLHEMLSSQTITPSSWQPGTEILSLDPDILASSSGSSPQLAKDTEYAKAILKSWKEDVDTRTAESTSICTSIEYKCSNNNGTSLHGYIYRRSTVEDLGTVSSNVPGLILFHTGAGPQDMFLKWKADSLVNDEIFPDGCVVLVADIIGDKDGWAWTDRSRYEKVRKIVLTPDENGERNELQCRSRAAVNTLLSQPGVDSSRLAGLGFCMGGHPILEMARMKIPSIKALVTYHGVFDGVERLSLGSNSNDELDESKPDLSLGSNSNDELDMSKPDVLICTGDDDPFVKEQHLQGAIAMFTKFGGNCRVISFENTRHGFTNPAQAYNPSDAFAFDAHAYLESFSATRSLLRKTFELDKED